MQWLRLLLLSYTFFGWNFGNTCGFNAGFGEDQKLKRCPYRTEDQTAPPHKTDDEICHPQLEECDPYNVFYSIEGTCNNLINTYYGRVQLPFNRMLPANYADDFCALRRSSDGSPLPSPRVIKTTLIQENEILSNIFNILFYSFGQWLTHDVSFQNPSSAQVSCCKNNAPDPNMPLDVCLPTMIPKNDPFYSQFGVTCVENKRSENTETFGCNIHPCAPINFATAYLDLSILYSSNNERIERIRLHKGGQLRTEYYGDNEAFPTQQSGSNCPLGGIEAQNNGRCFLIGDSRINQNPELTVIAVLFMRMHNYIARRLDKINPHWSDDRLFHVARRILIAMYQIITFKEHIPIIIGSEMTSIYALYPASTGYIEGYDPTIDPQTVGEYEAAAGRILHSLIRGKVPYEGSSGENRLYLLRNKFFNQEFLLQKDIFFNIVESYGLNRCDKQDTYYTEEVTNHLLATPEQEFGGDIFAVDTNRGRDHGLATYNDVREACGLRRFRSFQEMRGTIRHRKDIEKLKSLYKSVEDIDLYVGMLLENPVSDGLVGPTAACVTGESFYRFKYGDRLFCEFAAAGFSPAQLDSIRESTFSQILCTANQGQEYVYKYSFLVPSSENPRVHCSEIPKIDLTLWGDSYDCFTE